LAVTAKEAKVHKLPSTVLGMDASADGSQLYAACMDGGIYQVDVESGSKQLLARHESYASGACLVPQSSLLISAGYDGAIQWHDLAANQTIRKIAAHQFWSWQSAVSADGKLFASVTGQYLAGGPKYEPAPETEPSVKVFDGQSGKTIWELPHVPSVQAVAFSPDNQFVAAGNLMGEVRVWDVSSGKQVGGFTTPSFTSWGIIKAYCYQGGIYSLIFSPDSQSILVCGMGQMRDPNTGSGRQTWQRFAWRKEGAPKLAEIKDADAGGGHPESLAFHPSGQYFVMAGRLAQGKWNTAFFDTESGGLIHSFDTKSRLSKALFNRDGSRMFLAGGIGQPKAKDGKYPDFGRVYVYDIT